MKLHDALADPFVLRLRANLALHLPVRQEGIPGTRMAAVALILRLPHAQLPELLMIKRAEYANDPWSGHVALPGGRQEPDDADLAHTAAREVMEELSVGIDPSEHILGSLDDVAPRTPRLPPIVIRPFVAVVDAGVQLSPSAEVADAFWVPLQQLRDPATYVRAMVPARGEMLDVFGYRLGEHFVWGLTERILSRFFQVLDGAQAVER